MHSKDQEEKAPNVAWLVDSGGQYYLTRLAYSKSSSIRLKKPRLLRKSGIPNNNGNNELEFQEMMKLKPGQQCPRCGQIYFDKFRMEERVPAQ